MTYISKKIVGIAGQPKVPKNVWIGFNASTGGSADRHQIRRRPRSQVELTRRILSAPFRSLERCTGNRRIGANVVGPRLLKPVGVRQLCDTDVQSAEPPRTYLKRSTTVRTQSHAGMRIAALGTGCAVLAIAASFAISPALAGKTVAWELRRKDEVQFQQSVFPAHERRHGSRDCGGTAAPAEGSSATRPSSAPERELRASRASTSRRRTHRGSR